MNGTAEGGSLQRLAYELSVSALRHQETSLTELRERTGTLLAARPSWPRSWGRVRSTTAYPENEHGEERFGPTSAPPPPPRLGIPETRGNGARKS